MIRYAVRGRAAVLGILLASSAFTAAANAQEISAGHLKAAKDTIAALNATDRFDAILPNLAERLKSEYTLASPNFQTQISKTVDAEALALAPRRADLEKEVATTFAKSFTEDELKQIAAFYSSPVGKKYLQTLPLVQRETVRAAEIWANGISRDLTANSSAKLKTVMDANKVKAPAAQVEGQQPAAKP